MAAAATSVAKAACSPGGDFEATTYRERLKFELAGLCLSAIFVLVRVIGEFAGFVHGNWLPTALSLASILLHLLTMRWRNICCVSVATIVLDCILTVGSHPTVQVAFWELVNSPLHMGEVPSAGIYSMNYESLLHTFLFYISMSYSILFVYLFRHAVVGTMLGCMSYFPLLLAARRVLDARVPTHYHEPIWEVAILFVGLLVVVIAKSKSERYERKILELTVLHKRRKLTVVHKRQKFLADFFKEEQEDKKVGSEVGSSSCPSYVHPEVQRSLELTVARLPRLPHSEKSAPANMLPATLESFLRDAKVCRDKSIDIKGVEEGCSQMDCFPVNSTVWAEGQSHPTAVSQLAPGTRVLCWDSLQGVVKYAAVASIEVDSQATEWAEVRLVDGTRLTVTSDHPVQPWRAHGPTLGGRTVPAAHLSPMSDAVMVHKVVTVPVTVASVTCSSARDRGMHERASVTVHQPERYNILVADPGQDSEVRSLAVRSAGAMGRTHIKNTFLYVDEDDDQERPPRRATSEPPCIRQLAAPAGPPAGTAGSSGNASSTSTSRSWASEGDRSAVVVIPDTAPKVWGAKEDPQHHAHASLSELLRAQRAGASSIGARNHAAGTCVPCSLSFRGACAWGAACQYCHENQDHRQVKVRGKKSLLPR